MWGRAKGNPLCLCVGGAKGNSVRKPLCLWKRPKERKFLKEILREMFKEGLKENP